MNFLGGGGIDGMCEFVGQKAGDVVEGGCKQVLGKFGLSSGDQGQEGEKEGGFGVGDLAKFASGGGDSGGFGAADLAKLATGGGGDSGGLGAGDLMKLASVASGGSDDKGAIGTVLNMVDNSNKDEGGLDMGKALGFFK